MTNIIQVSNLSKVYKQGKQEICVFNGINFTMKEGEIVALIGPSGSGKSTFLNLLGLLDNPTEGEIYINQHKVSDINEKQKEKIRSKNIGFIFQFHYLLPDFTALENVMLPYLINNINKIEAKKSAIKILERLGLKNRIGHYPSMMSGGEQQRVAIARAISLNPSLIIADEPTGNLDRHNAKEVFNLLMDLAKESRLSILIASHDMEMVQYIPRKIKMINHKLVDI